MRYTETKREWIVFTVAVIPILMFWIFMENMKFTNGWSIIVTLGFMSVYIVYLAYTIEKLRERFNS